MTHLRQKYQKGFSLVELMVALVISLLLLAGILQILLGNKQSFKAQQSTAGIQEDVRLASFVIENVIAHAGYRDDLSASNNALFPARGDTSNDLSIVRGAYISSKYNASGNDSIRIRFQAAGGVHDCLGTDIGVPADPSNKKLPQDAMADFALLVDDKAQLSCATYSDNDVDQRKITQVDSSSAPATPQPLVSNVDRLKIRYGLDTNNDGSVDRYSNTLDATTAKQVLSVRVQTLIASDQLILPSAVKQTYQFADGSNFEVNDRRARRLLDQTIALRNAMTEQQQ